MIDGFRTHDRYARTSHLLQHGHGSDLVIAEILSVSQRNNDRDGLTGALAVSDGWFLQVVGGPTAALDSLLRRLQADPRHTNLLILARRRVPARLFGDWSMQSARVNPDIAPDLRILIDECRASPDDAAAALLRLVSAQRPAGR